MGLLKQLLCKHQLIHIRNIHGDEIIGRNWKRSEWQCEKCKKYKYEDELHKI